MTTIDELAAVIGLHGLEQLPDGDQAAVVHTLVRLFGGFQQRDADALVDVYSDDADWVNAFGVVKNGSADIVDYLRGLFADPGFSQGSLVAAPVSVLRRVSDDVVIVSTHLQVVGQGLVDGGNIALRDNHSLHVLVRQPDRTWMIESELFMDAREDQTYGAHS